MGWFGIVRNFSEIFGINKLESLGVVPTANCLRNHWFGHFVTDRQTDKRMTDGHTRTAYIPR